jgi:hypothetical protein
MIVDNPDRNPKASGKTRDRGKTAGERRVLSRRLSTVSGLKNALKCLVLAGGRRVVRDIPDTYCNNEFSINPRDLIGRGGSPIMAILAQESPEHWPEGCP